MRKLILFSLILCIAVLSSWLLVSTAATPNRITRVSIATDGTQADNFSYGSAVASTGTPQPFSHSAARRIWVVLPDPSPPSKVMNFPM